MARIILVYGTRYGHTAKVAAVIAHLLRLADHRVDVVRGDQLAPDASLASYDAIIIGGSVIATHHQRYLYRLVRRHRALLRQKPSAFFSVSGAAAGTRPRDQAEARRFAQQFLDRTSWHPMQVGIFAGAAYYSRYTFLNRVIMQLYMWRQGGDTDPSHDYEYTDWNAVRDFALTTAAMFAQYPGNGSIRWIGPRSI